MKRTYEEVLKEHIKRHDQMIFLAGPRQVGKTTLVKSVLGTTSEGIYLNWDIPLHRKKIIAFAEDPKSIIDFDIACKHLPIIVFDEIHKFKNWKNFLKGFYDLHRGECKIIVTGSAKLNIYKKGGDSLMGRYFLYRMHPITLGEILGNPIGNQLLHVPTLSKKNLLENLISFGGFPDPYIKKDKKFLHQWQRLRMEQLFKEDIRELSRVYDLGQMEILALMLTEQAGKLINYSNLANKVQVTVNTIKNWLNILEQMYFCFRLKPWHKNVSRSLIKEPKIFLWDWSLVNDYGSRIENCVASHLLKSIQAWTDNGLGEFDLYFLRDKDKKEIDFLVTREKKPWFIVEVKSSFKDGLNPNLTYFQSQTKALHAFQVAFDMEYVDINFEKLDKPKIIPLCTFLSQLY